MNMLLQKGSDYNATYASADYPVLIADWTGSVSFYLNYPGTPVFTKALTVVDNKFVLNLTVGEILNLVVGVYSVVASFSNTVLGVEMSSLEYATVLAINTSSVTMCKIFGTVIKLDGTPTGNETKVLGSSSTGLQVNLDWEGIQVKATLPVAEVSSGDVVSIENVVTTTNTVGYFELYVIQGLTVIVSCLVFGKNITVNTTGHTAVDISTLL